MLPASNNYIALIRVLSRLLWRAALLACISFLFTAASITGTAVLYAASASLLLPASMDLTTDLIFVRRLERWLAFSRRFFTACRARFLAEAIFAKDVSYFSRVLVKVLALGPRTMVVRYKNVNL